MQRIIISLLISVFTFLASCNYKELGCVICHTKKKTIVEKYPNQNIKEQTKKTIKTRAIDTPVKEISKILTYDSTGNIIKKERRVVVRSVWMENSIYYKSVSQTDSLNGKYVIIEKHVSRNGEEVVDKSKIKRKY